MIERWNDPIEQWARDRGLEYVPDGLLPAWSAALAAGLGAGTHRAGLVTHRTANSAQAVGGLKKWPERGSHHLCRGRLPGGLEGVLAHHVHLALDSFGADDGQSWYAFPDTVVLARLVEGSRVVTHLRARPGAPGEVKALFTFGGGDDAAPALPVAGPQTLTRGSHTWTADPPEDPAILDAIMSRELDEALIAAPEGTEVELRYGALCVSAPNAITQAAALDALCRVATAVAAGVARAAALLPSLDAAEPLPAPPVTPRSQWIDAGVARVQWPQPPASVPEAAAAYAEAVRHEARGAGSSMRLIAFGAAVVVTILVAAAVVLGGRLFGDNNVEIAAFIVISAPFFLWRLGRSVLHAGREASDDHIAARATPWGIEAFARGYAAQRGLQLEDRDAFRRRFDSPVPGEPLKVMFGPIAAGAPAGRLVLWLDRLDLAVKRYFVLAVVPGPHGPEVVSREVTDAERSAATLDALAVEAALRHADTPLISR
jgi:hypothetical protein